MGDKSVAKRHWLSFPLRRIAPEPAIGPYGIILEVPADTDLDAILPYVKTTASNGEPQANYGALHMAVSATPVTRPFVGSLLTTYVINEGGWFRYISEEDATRAGVRVEALHERAVANFAALVTKQRLRMPKYHAITPVLFDGNLEVSVMFLDDVWDWFVTQFGEPEILAVAPARDILAFCPGSSQDGRSQLGELIDRVWPGADHRLTRDYYRRVRGAWQLDTT